MNPIFSRTLQQGYFSLPGGDVYILQQMLEELGYGDFVPTGFFGIKTLTAVRKFQFDNNIIPSTGVFGVRTQPALIAKISEKRRLSIYKKALECLNVDVTPADEVPDEYACAETVSAIIFEAGFTIGKIVSTSLLYNFFQKKDREWIETYTPLPGDIIISPTGHGNGQLANGHVGIVGEKTANDTLIMSNTSANGKFQQNYTLSTWKARYENLGGFPVVFFRKL